MPVTTSLYRFNQVPGWDCEQYQQARALFNHHVFSLHKTTPLNFCDYLPHVTPEINAILHNNCKYTGIPDFGTRVGVLYNANFIHQWFVTNIQGGQDICKMYIVSPDKLQRLEKMCNLALFYPEITDSLFPVLQNYSEELWAVRSKLENMLKYLEKAQETDWNSNIVVYQAHW